MARSVNTRNTTESAHATPLPPGESGRTWLKSQCQTHMIPETG